MNDKHEHVPCSNTKFGRHRGRPNSYWMQDADEVFRVMAVKEGDCFVDMGCGQGKYSLHASRLVGSGGKVIALDRGESNLRELKQRINGDRIQNIQVDVANIAEHIPVASDSADVCMLATVLHSLDLDSEGAVLFSEIKRILKPGGHVAILECKKENTGFGPPLSMRCSPEEMEKLLKTYGLTTSHVALFHYSYLLMAGLEQS